MIDGMMILGQWNSMQLGALLLIMIGVIGLIGAAIVTATLWNDISPLQRILGISAVVVAAVMVLVACCIPVRKGLRVTLTDPTKMPELVEKYDVVNTDGLILDIEERRMEK